ncbi:MAG: IS21 family transposase [Methanofollis sp.]|uniref:IS21 family transposase n=1 Tax=Methanofollis sp. TaxID=2052835 RepID=UPI0026247EA1|nr:IS21 family transposase [Methanofollis sp.]MDD4256194.1 IS21 family transposase [Methanofollis sp.]
MARKEYTVVDVVDILRRVQNGYSIRAITRATGMDRNTLRKYLRLAYKKGFGKDGLCDLETIAREVVREVQSSLPGPQRSIDQVLIPHKATIASWMENEHLTLTKIHILLSRMGVEVSYPGLYRFVSVHIGLASKTTVRMADTEPGEAAEVDFGRLGFLYDSAAARRRSVYGLVVTLCSSRHQYVHVTFTQDLPSLITGIEDAWAFFGGITKKVVIDNLKAAVVRSDRYSPVFNRTFLEYSQFRGFIIDPARPNDPTGKPKVEREVPYVRKNFFAGETFRDLSHVQEEAIRWCRDTAGMRVHGTTRKRPLVVFNEEEKMALLPLTEERFDVPRWGSVKVHPDHHIRFGSSLYSVPTRYIGREVSVRKDTRLLRIYYKGELVKTHPAVPQGRRSTDFNDYPKEKAPYAMRSCTYYVDRAGQIGPAARRFAELLLSGTFPWTKLRQAQKLVRLPERYGKERVEKACERSLAFELVDVRRIEEIIQQGLVKEDTEERRLETLPSRFARPAAYFVKKEE